MSEVIIAALISAAAAIVVGLINSRAQHNKLIAELDKRDELQAYRIEQLERKVDKHNQVIARTYKLEECTELLGERIKVANRRIDDLEQSVKAIQDLTISVHALAQDMRQMLSELKDQGTRLERFDGRLEALEQQPARRWQRMSDKVLDTAVGLLAGAVITGLAMLAVQYIR